VNEIILVAISELAGRAKLAHVGFLQELTWTSPAGRGTRGVSGSVDDMKNPLRRTQGDYTGTRTFFSKLTLRVDPLLTLY
jgi:hypothetical protein